MAPSKELRFDNQVAVVTGAGAGLGRQYALCLASRGCKVVVNDLGGTFNGVGNSTSSKVADQVVEEIRKAGGEAVANYDNVLDGEKIVQTAVGEWGRVDILINNAGILRDVSLRNMKDADWDAIIGVHLHGAYKTSRAAWPYMRKQKFGRIIQTTSASGLFGNFGQSNYAAAKVALVGFGETLAKEGAKYNITCNILAPGAASRLTQTVWTEEMMRLMSTSWVVPLPIFLVHSSCNSNGALFEAGAGHFAKIRWERSRGLTLKTKGLTPQHILDNWSQVMDFTNAEHPDGPPEMMKLLQNANGMPDNKPVSNDGLQLKGKVALVTGGGAGLGRAYAMELAKYGCKVMVCDVKNAAAVAEEIKKAGGEARSTDISAERGDEVVKAVIDAYGRIDIAVNNAGILRDKSMSKMSFEEWTQVMNCHLRSTFKVTKAAFPYMTKQKFGRIVNVTSTSGIYGNFGQANYAAAKAGIIGFTKAIGREGQKYNIKTNVLAPSAGTAMTKTIWPQDLVSAMDPSFVSPVVALLCSAACPINGTIIEAAGGWFATTRWQRTRGVDFDFEGGYPSVEDVAEVFDKIVRFDEEADWPETPAEGSYYTHQNVVKYLEAKAKL